ncbi:MAG: phytanoyl-CoA dioxygenase family protein, partial [candidate division Zixibacteria bacterium]|nr:phytanoyl-CoA dioxygenase family protein [candidate division Zixibacteria bacterium]
PRIGKPTPPHQDGYYFMLDPMIAMTFWIAVDRADRENGCIRYVPGSHRKGMRPHALSNVLGFSQGLVDFGEEDSRIEEEAMVAPGDVIAHHCMTIHRTDANPSDRQRRALGCVYFGKSAKVDREGQQAYQKMLFEKWENEGKI